MSNLDSELDRLLRAAADPAEAEGEEAPFGFETRVVAQWQSARAGTTDEGWSLAAWSRPFMIGAVILAAVAGAGAFWELKENDDLAEPTSNAYALADSVIEAATWQ